MCVEKIFNRSCKTIPIYKLYLYIKNINAANDHSSILCLMLFYRKNPPILKHDFFVGKK